MGGTITFNEGSAAYKDYNDLRDGDASTLAKYNGITRVIVNAIDEYDAYDGESAIKGIVLYTNVTKGIVYYPGETIFWSV